MMKRRFTQGLAVLGLLGACILPAHGYYDESENVQRTNGDPSPTADDSRVNNYVNQQEKIDVKPTDGVVKVLRTDQKNLINDFETAIFPIKSALPREMRNVMRMVTGIEGGRAEIIQDKVSKQYFMQVMAPRYMIPYLREAVAGLDVPWLKEYWDGATDIYVKAQNRGASDVDAIASRYAGDDGFSQVDTTNNSIRRYDEDYRTKEYVKAAAIVDIPANQVLLDVKMYEVNANNDTKIGLDYIAWKNGPGRNLWQFAASGAHADQWALALTSIYDPFINADSPVKGDDKRHVLDGRINSKYRSVNYLMTSNYIDFLQSKGKARLLTSQQLMVASSKAATISAEQQLLAAVNNVNDVDTVGNTAPAVIVRKNDGSVFVDKNENGTQDKDEPTLKKVVDPDSAPTTVSIEDSNRRLHYSNAGTATTALTVTPYVGLESMELDLNLQIGDVNGIAPSGLPIINTRTVATTVRLLDGQPYVIAGVKRSHDSRNSAKSPFFGDIPVIGYLFGGETNLKRDTSLVITITPHFILSSQKNIAPAPRVDTLKAIVGGKKPLGLPSNPIGYDQWLLNG